MIRESIALLCQNGRQALAQQDHPLARRFYQAAVVLKEDDAEAHHGLATVCFLLNDLDKAIHHFTEVTKCDPSRAGAYINLGAIYNQRDRLDEAIQVLRKGIQLDPHRGEGYYNLALAHKKKGQLELAIQAYLEAIRVNPKMADAYLNLANLYMEIERYGQAISHYKKALELRPRWDRAEDGLLRAEAAQSGVPLPEATVGPAPAGETRAPPREEPALPQRVVDPTRVVDPNLHGPLLKHLHQAMLDADIDGRKIADLLHTELEPGIKELSAALLMSDKPVSELEERLRKFEKAVLDFRKIQDNLQQRMQRIQAAGERLLDS